MAEPRERFDGVIGRTVATSVPWWPDPPAPARRTPSGRAPNVLIVLYDDTGFAHFGCYGSTIDTPTVDRLAAEGLRYTGFHTTALCSPTRASLLTGRHHHSVGMRAVSNFDTGFPHMRGRISRHAATLAEMLRPLGYATHCVGKWHLAPMTEASAAGPFGDWPLGRGFDRYYGFLQGETDQFHPELTYDNHPVDPPRGPEQGYHLTEDLIDRAIGFIRDTRSVRPDQPWFCYVAFGATHAPHQAPREFIDRYRGAFDHGWDAVREEWFARQLEMGIVPEGTRLAPRNPGVRPWAELSEPERRFAARLQEVFAGFLTHTDHHLGRLVDFLAGIGELDDTLVIVTSDNGASQEGGPTGVTDEFKYFNAVPEDIDEAVARLEEIGGPHSHPNYPWGWAQAGNTPLKWYKQNTFGGGVRDPLVIRWPADITGPGGIRPQFHHVTDITPTVLEVLGVEAPPVVDGYEQMPIDGTSMVYTFTEEGAPTRKRVQYFEMFGHRGIYCDGWKAVTYHRPGRPFDDSEWELYHLDEDFSESRNVADEHPGKLRELIELWWAEAGRHGVLPLDDRTIELFAAPPRPGSPHARRTYRYLPPVSHVPADVAPRLGNRTFVIRAVLDRPGGACGVIVALGSHNAGISFYVDPEGHLVFDYNWFTRHTVARSPSPLPTGRVSVGVRFERIDDTGEITLLVDDAPVGSPVRVPRILRMISSTGMDIGRDALSPVTDAYEAPFPFGGTITEVVFDLPRRTPTAAAEDAEIAARSEMGRQ